MKDQINVSSNSKISMPIFNLIGIIAMVGTVVLTDLHIFRSKRNFFDFVSFFNIYEEFLRSSSSYFI